MSNKARIAVIGTGWWATDYHLPGLKANPDAEVVAICDTDPVRLEKAAAAYPAGRAYSDYHAMLANEELDGAMVITPHSTHYAIARDCLERGLHLLIEKPMTLYARDARELVALAAEKGKELMVGYPYLFSPPAQRAHAVVSSGELGQVHYVVSSFTSDMTYYLGGNVSKEKSIENRYKVQGPSDAYNRPELMGGGQGHLQLTHGLGLMFYITGLRARSVNARMSNHGRKMDMVDALCVEFDNGALGIVGSSGVARVGSGTLLSVLCDEGACNFDTALQAAVLQRKDGKPEDLYKLGHWGSRYSVTDNFVAVVLGRAANGSTGENGLRVVEVLDAAYRSAQQDGQSVRIDDLYR
jgi:predicted dehydrogenase